jgi:hypothetical protein
MQVTTIGIDLAKNVFRVHGVDHDGKAVPRGCIFAARLKCGVLPLRLRAAAA